MTGPELRAILDRHAAEARRINRLVMFIAAAAGFLAGTGVFWFVTWAGWL